MNKKINPAYFAGIIKPGEVYTLSFQGERGGDLGPIEFIYTIRSADEIPLAIEMEMDIILAELYEYKEFLGVKMESENCFQLMFLCFDKEKNTEIHYGFYLHRIHTFGEMLINIKLRFGVA